MKDRLFCALFIGAFAISPALAANEIPAPPPKGMMGGGGMGGDSRPTGAMAGPRFEAMREHMQERSAEMFKKMDSNGDGKVSQEEHAAFFKQRFTEIDANKDGFITEDEIRAHRMKEMMDRKDTPPMGGGMGGMIHNGAINPPPGVDAKKDAGMPVGQ